MAGEKFCRLVFFSFDMLYFESLYARINFIDNDNIPKVYYIYPYRLYKTWSTHTSICMFIHPNKDNSHKPDLKKKFLLWAKSLCILHCRALSRHFVLTLKLPDSKFRPPDLIAHFTSSVNVTPVPTEVTCHSPSLTRT